tara:strand:- start:39270 stop:40379 length:1110 start_codon:yes stop_codon:yes gene_type:complete
MRKIKIPWAMPLIDSKELNQVKESFKSQMFTQGKKVLKFEDKILKHFNSKYVAAVSNGTVALDLALKALDIKNGDEIIVPAISYISSASSISYQGATPVFVDVDINNCCIDTKKIKAAISKKTKAIIFIDYGGNPADHKDLRKISKKYKIPLIHDAAQSLGSKYLKKALGQTGLISTMSFHMAKVITTVEGGAVFSNSKTIHEKIKVLRNIGEPKNKKYQHELLGTNARMTELQAGIGIEQIDKLNFILKQRNRVAKTYNKFFLNNKNIKLFKTLPKYKNANFFYPILIKNRDYVSKKLLRDYSIDTRIAYPKPIYKQNLYKNGKNKFKKFNCKNAEYISKHILNLPIFPQMNLKEIEYVVLSLNKVIN